MKLQEASCKKCRLIWQRKSETYRKPFAMVGVKCCKVSAFGSCCKSVLCVPATSTSSERVFSTLGIIADKRRSRMTPELIDALVFLNRNKHVLGYEEKKSADEVSAEPQGFIYDPESCMEPDLPKLPEH